MKIDTVGRVQDLARCLHSLQTPVDSLPVHGYRPETGTWRPRPAAVLIPLQLDPEPALLLTVRSRKLMLHAGQVAFPGGGRHSGESFPLETALRETREEIGIAAGDFELLGLLDCFDTITGYRVTPVVARVRGQPDLQPCPDEVEEIFRVSWLDVIDPGSYRHHRVVHGNRCYELVSMDHSRRLIWGATAAILEQLCGKVGGRGEV